MALSPSQLQENLGTVVPVDDESTVTFKVPSIAGVSSNVPSQPVPTGPGPGNTSTGATNDQRNLLCIWKYIFLFLIVNNA